MRQHMIKKEGWHTRLHAYIEAKKDAAFEYGVFDCALFVIGAVEAMNNGPLELPFSWADEDSALAIVEAGFEGRVEQVLGSRAAISVLKATVGDIGVAVWEDVSETLCICDGIKFLGLSKDRGVIAIPRKAVRFAWRII